MGAKYGAATSLRSCCVVLGDQDGWGTNRLSKAESILGTGMSQNLSRGRRHACVQRCRAEREITYPRAALIKGCLNRATRYSNPDQKEELTVS
uniref:type I-C CRISPR-associated protein Cas8c/Csd1 n=1 Tax=Thiolapillus sp. TaxID=2017437 RepID=UPI003AF9C397